MFGGFVGLMVSSRVRMPAGVQVSSTDQGQQNNQQKALHLGSIIKQRLSLYTPRHRIEKALAEEGFELLTTNHQLPIYRNSSIACSSASRLGRVTDSGSVASGWSVIFNMSIKVGALGLT